MDDSELKPKYCCTVFCKGNSQNSKLFRLPTAGRAAILKYLKRDDKYIHESINKQLSACICHFKLATKHSRTTPYVCQFYTDEDRHRLDPVLAEAILFNLEDASINSPALLRRDVVEEVDPIYAQKAKEANEPEESPSAQKRQRMEDRMQAYLKREYANEAPLKLGEKIEEQQER